MNKIQLLAFAMCCSGLEAQIQITQSSMPSSGDTIRYSNSSSFTFDYTVTGANYTWDFRSLDNISQDVHSYKTLLGTPYGSLAFTGMPIGAIGLKIADSIGQGQTALKNIYSFFDKKTAAWSAVGTGFTPAALPFPAGGVYNDKDEIYVFPLNYNDYDSTTFDVTTPIGNQFLQLGSFRQKGQRVTTVEGWGNISTPYGNTINCLKLKSVVKETDSLKVQSLSLNIGFEANRVEYRWLSTGEKIPVLEVTGTEIAGTFTPTLIRYRDNYRSPGPSVFKPRVRFDANKYNGKAGMDTIRLINLSTPIFGSNYQWSFQPNNGLRFVDGTNASSEEPSIIFDSAGQYSVSLTADNLAGSDDSTASNMIVITKDPQQSIFSSNHTNLLGVYPVPTSHSIKFKNSSMIGMVCRVFDLSGKLVIESLITSDLSLYCGDLPKGLYTLVLTNPETIHYTQITIE